MLIIGRRFLINLLSVLITALERLMNNIRTTVLAFDIDFSFHKPNLVTIRNKNSVLVRVVNLLLQGVSSYSTLRPHGALCSLRPQRV